VTTGLIKGPGHRQHQDRDPRYYPSGASCRRVTGGPLVITPRRLIGVVSRRPADDRRLGFALKAQEAAPVIDEARARRPRRHRFLHR